MIDLLLEVKQRCRFDDVIGETMNLHGRELTFLTAIAEDSAISSRGLSEISGLSPSRSSRVISGLTLKGLISINRDENDRRIINLNLTENGRKCVEGLNKEKLRCENELIAKLSEEEKETVISGLKILLNKI
ncbi:MAG: hypothetical protein JEZ04_11300 [Spirochaetales bacterium]|nr:hypothetical protein [Spirochaetales bacterium]